MKKLILLFLFLFGSCVAANAQIFGPGLQFTTTDPTGGSCVATSVVVYMPSGKLFTCQNGILTAVSGGGGSGTIAVTPNMLAGDNAGNAVSAGFLPAAVAQINHANAFGAGFKQSVQASATTAGFNFGGVTADPSGKATGDLWFRTDLTVPGVSYYDGSAVRSIMVGPGAATDSNLVCFSGTGGLLTKDCGIGSATVVLGAGNCGTANQVPYITSAGTVTCTSSMVFSGSVLSVQSARFGNSSSNAGASTFDNGGTGSSARLIQYNGSATQLNLITASGASYIGGGPLGVGPSNTGSANTCTLCVVDRTATTGATLAIIGGDANTHFSATSTKLRIAIGSSQSTTNLFEVTNQSLTPETFVDQNYDVSITGQKAATGQRFVCIDTGGKLVSSATACVGT